MHYIVLAKISIFPKEERPDLLPLLSFLVTICSYLFKNLGTIYLTSLNLDGMSIDITKNPTYYNKVGFITYLIELIPIQHWLNNMTMRTEVHWHIKLF